MLDDKSKMTKILSILLMLILFMPIFGCSKEKEVVGCVSGDCSDGFGTFIGSDGSKYIGEFQNYLLNGNGTYIWPDGTKYVGEWRNNLPNGRGTATWPPGFQYDGEWKDGVFHGHGTYITPSGIPYEGEWSNGALFYINFQDEKER